MQLNPVLCMMPLLYFEVQAMRAAKDISLRLSLSYFCRRWVSNVSEKAFKYSFDVGSVRVVHPMRELSMGTDRLLITSNLIAVSDHGEGTIGKRFGQNLDDSYSEKLLKVLNSFFYHEVDKYMQNPYDLVESAVQSIKLEGKCTLTLAMAHPSTGETVFYYLGDSLYGIFQEKQVIMVEALYEAFNQPYKIGKHFPSSGFVERYPYKEIKNDTIVIGSNGLWDNVGLDGLHYEVRGPNSFEHHGRDEQRAKGEARPQESMAERRSLQSMAERVGNMAAFYSRKGQYESPIHRRAKRQGFQFPKEGYLDDIAVVVAKVKREITIK